MINSSTTSLTVVSCV